MHDLLLKKKMGEAVLTLGLPDKTHRGGKQTPPPYYTFHPPTLDKHTAEDTSLLFDIGIGTRI